MTSLKLSHSCVSDIQNICRAASIGGLFLGVLGTLVQLS